MDIQGGKFSLLKRIVKNPRVLSVVMAGSMVAFGILYVAQVNAAATKGYAVRELQQRNVELRNERDRLDIQIAKLRSLHSVKTREAFLGLQSLTPSVFIEVNTNVVAVR